MSIQNHPKRKPFKGFFNCPRLRVKPPETLLMPAVIFRCHYLKNFVETSEHILSNFSTGIV
ncbi:UNVERIFIED_ORG: hypothetical protein QOE_4069 [Clostridioides difficile F501]